MTIPFAGGAGAGARLGSFRVRLLITPPRYPLTPFFRQLYSAAMKETEDNGKRASAKETLAGLMAEWRELLGRAVDEAEKFTREKPVAGLSVAFLAGLLLGGLFRRR